MRISSLKEQPLFADTVAGRGWNAWRMDSGVPLEVYRQNLNPMMEGEGIPLCLVAHDGETYIGSVLLIENDLEERPDYTPWIAALWVEPRHRRQGVASRLIKSAILHARECGYRTCYLCATPDKSSYYIGQGFTQIESGVGELNVFLISTPSAGI